MNPANVRRAETIHAMAHVIADCGLPLADHRGIIFALHGATYRPSEIDQHLVEAIQEARDMRRARGAQSVGSLAARIVGRV